MKVQFFKGEATGNDFIVLTSPSDRPLWLTRSAVSKLCDRHFGIGADGILVIGPSSRADFFMRIFNADGSEAEMCGNGIRVAVLFAKDVLGIQKESVSVETLAGIKRCQYSFDDKGDFWVTVNMGAPKAESLTVKLGKRRFVGWQVDTGNPHFVVLSEDAKRDAVEFGPRLTNHSVFPKGANIHFVERLEHGNWLMVPYERGVGLTLSCGTGATATAYVLVYHGLAGTSKVSLALPGGLLEATVKEGTVTLKGPARLVFEGSIDMDIS